MDEKKQVKTSGFYVTIHDLGNGSSCRSDGFQCRNGDCIKKVYQCDREHDCDDKSDEIDCPGKLDI